MNYDKKTKKPDPNTALGSHEKYISSLSELQDSIAAAKRDHRNTVSRRERYTHSLTAQIACRLSEAQFLAIERQLRGCGPSLLKIKEWAPYAGIDMPPPTLATNGDPTINIRSASFEEYTARHSTNSYKDGGNSSVQSASMPGMLPGATSTPHSPAPVITLTEMPQITLSPFAPMQQHLEKQHGQDIKGEPPNSTFSPTPSRLPPTATAAPTPTTLPTSMPVPPVKTPVPVNLPTTMPEPQNYMPQKTISKPIVPASNEVKVAPVMIASIDHKVLVPEPTVVKKRVDVPEQPTPIVTTPVPTTIAPKPILKEVTALTTSPPTTPGAFPEAEPVVEQDSLKHRAQTTVDRAEGSLPEDQGSVSTKVDSIGGGSTTIERLKEGTEYSRDAEGRHGMAQVKHIGGVLDGYPQNDYIDRFGYPEERSDMYRDNRRLDIDRDDLDMGREEDEMYHDLYSPASDHHHYYDERDDELSRIEPRRYFDDDDSQHSGTISSLPRGRNRGEYYGRSRYDDGQSERSYQRYSSSVPNRHLGQHQHQQQQQAY
ncbi:hypothetical protein BGZ94_004763, partial [Podila epigama]